MEHLVDSPVTAYHIRVWTRRDPILAKVLQYVRGGWPADVDTDLQNFTPKKTELSIHEGCVLWGSRVVIPPQGRQAVLQKLHGGHPGMTRMKSLARMYVWWPGIDKDIEMAVQTCTECQLNQSTPPLAPLHPWKWPLKPSARLHLDFAGPVSGQLFLVLIDAHLKWIEAFPTKTTSSAVVITHLLNVCAQFGIPETIVMDNGTGCVSEEFEKFLHANGVTSAPYHPASNGLAERAVQIIKKGFKKVTEGSISTCLARILSAYRVTPQSTTSTSPAQLLLGHQPCTRLDLLRPDLKKQVEDKQTQQKVAHDKSSRDRSFSEGDLVYARDYGHGLKWMPGTIEEKTGPVSFLIQTEDGQLVRRHVDQIRPRKAVTSPQVQETTPDGWDSPVGEEDVPDEAVAAEGTQEPETEPLEAAPPEAAAHAPATPPPEPVPQQEVDVPTNTQTPVREAPRPETVTAPAPSTRTKKRWQVGTPKQYPLRSRPAQN